MSKELWLIRHGETAWSLSGQHTGRTDIELTSRGKDEAGRLRDTLAGHEFALALTSPLKRALETCRIAGLSDRVELEPNLQEWHYGDYEGRTAAEISKERPGWSVWTHGVPNGELVEDVGDRANAVIERALQADGDVALFAHGHLLRVLAACWLEFAPQAGRKFALNTASISVLGYERETRVIRSWNRVFA
jgi:probable phosphoglycerate mutase